MTRGLRWLLLWALLISGAAWAEAPEVMMLRALQALQQGNMDQALRVGARLRDAYPDYRLGQLLWLQLNAVLADDRALLRQMRQRHGDALQLLMAEAQVRWRHQNSVPPEKWVRRWILKPGHYPWWVVVDLSGSRLYLFRRYGDTLEPVFDTYVSMGQKGYGKRREGDRRTPVGIYRIVEWIPDEKLPPLYGAGALPLDYPNAWDRAKGRTGSGIWLHGTPPDTWSRPPRSSRGCVVMSNKGLTALKAYFRLPLGTPVLLVDRLDGYAPLNTTGLELATDSAVARYPGEQRLLWVADRAGPISWWRADGEGGWQLALRAAPVLAHR